MWYKELRFSDIVMTSNMAKFKLRYELDLPVSYPTMELIKAIHFSTILYVALIAYSHRLV